MAPVYFLNADTCIFRQIIFIQNFSQPGISSCCADKVFASEGAFFSISQDIYSYLIPDLIESFYCTITKKFSIGFFQQPGIESFSIQVQE